MARDGKVEVLFGGDVRLFRLGIDELLAVEDACKSAVADIRSRLALKRWWISDVREPLRLGLLGGGMEPEKVRKLIDEHVAPGRIERHAMTALIVVNAALLGEDLEDEADPKAEDAGAAPESPQGGSLPASSSDGAPSLD